jgi:hypothetical protein
MRDLAERLLQHQVLHCMLSSVVKNDCRSALLLQSVCTSSDICFADMVVEKCTTHSVESQLETLLR